LPDDERKRIFVRMDKIDLIPLRKAANKLGIPRTTLNGLCAELKIGRLLGNQRVLTLDEFAELKELKRRPRGWPKGKKRSKPKK